ncbi:MAG: ThiF family adenylyltransferase [Pirellulaceae bacterium]
MKSLFRSKRTGSGRETVVRMTRTTGQHLFDHMRADPHREQMAFALGHHTQTPDGTMFLLRELILPDEVDLAEQSVAGIRPTQAFLTHAYWSALQSHSTIIEFHTHPGAAPPTFSGTDDFHALRNARYIAQKFPDPVTLVLIVGNNLFDAFDGVVYDRHQGEFRQLDRLEVLGRPTRVWSMGKVNRQELGTLPAVFDRQQRIPGWNQPAIEAQCVGIIGVGGNGAPLLQTLLSIGAGRHGFVAIADHDLVEHSNLPRLPYACDHHVGKPKVAAATEYARLKSPSTKLYPFQCRFNEQAVSERFKMATVIFFCGDSDGGRKEANEFSTRYGIPLIDLGCDIQVSESQVIAGGQVRLVLPGENGCLVCCGGFDAGQAALDQMSQEARTERAARGYVQGADAQATPSVANLNGLTAQYALSQFLALVHGEQFAQWDYLHFDQFTGRTIPARTTRLEQCPLCGRSGHLLHGEVAHNSARHKPKSAKFKREASKKVPSTIPKKDAQDD